MAPRSPSTAKPALGLSGTATAPKQHPRSFRALEQWIGAVGMIIHVAAIIFAALEVIPHFVPEPSIIWSMESQATPTFQTEVFSFRNSSARDPIEDFEADWAVSTPHVQLSVSKLIASHDVDSPTATERVLKIPGDVAAGSQFTAYLHADEPFQVLSEEFRATIPKIVQSGAYHIPANFESEEDWKSQENQQWREIIGVVLLLVAFIFVVQRASSLARQNLSRGSLS